VKENPGASGGVRTHRIYSRCSSKQNRRDWLGISIEHDNGEMT